MGSTEFHLSDDLNLKKLEKELLKLIKEYPGSSVSDLIRKRLEEVIESAVQSKT